MLRHASHRLGLLRLASAAPVADVCLGSACCGFHSSTSSHKGRSNTSVYTGNPHYGHFTQSEPKDLGEALDWTMKQLFLTGTYRDNVFIGSKFGRSHGEARINSKNHFPLDSLGLTTPSHPFHRLQIA